MLRFQPLSHLSKDNIMNYNSIYANLQSQTSKYEKKYHSDHERNQ